MDYQLEDEDYEILQKVKNFDFKKIFCRNPTQIEKKKGEEFMISQSELPEDIKNTHINQTITTPSILVLDIQDSQENIQKYLLRKIKRNTAKINPDLPQSIQNLIKDYGDVCVNFTQSTLKKYQYYKRFYNFAYK